MSMRAMQVYFDEELTNFYKDYAKKMHKPFATIVRSVLQQHKAKLENIPSIQKTHTSLLQTIQKAEKLFSSIPYLHKHKTDNQLLYGK